MINKLTIETIPLDKQKVNVYEIQSREGFFIALIHAIVIFNMHQNHKILMSMVWFCYDRSKLQVQYNVSESVI